SLVGPRPPIPYEIDAYEAWHRRRLYEGKPGITGSWQVHGRSRTTFDEMVRLDLHYARERSPALDLKILMQTPRAVCSGDGAFSLQQPTPEHKMKQMPLGQTSSAPAPLPNQ